MSGDQRRGGAGGADDRAEATARLAAGAMNAGLVWGMASHVMWLGALSALWHGLLRQSGRPPRPR